MKIRKNLTAIFAVVVLIALIGWWFWSYRKPVSIPEQQRTPEKTPLSATEQATMLALGLSNEAAFQSGPPTLASTGALTKTTVDHNIPIHFWGKIIDQNETPLAGVTVKAHIRRWSMSLSGASVVTYNKHETVTGVDGRFEVHGDFGDSLTIDALEKDGLEPEPSALRTFGYNLSENIAVSVNQPTVLRMWKTDIRATLITDDKGLRLIPDGRVYTIDLLQGNISDLSDLSGDLKVWIKRPEQIAFGQKYDWSCGLKVINGGIVEENDGHASMYLAPAEGYEQEFRAERKTNDPIWGDRLGSKRFYLKCRNGQVYGRLEIAIYAYYNENFPARVRIKYAVNASGSRILR